jgi:hypothetical protein
MLMMVEMDPWIVNDSDIDFDDDDIQLFLEDSKKDSLVGRLLKKEFEIPAGNLDLDNGSDDDDDDDGTEDDDDDDDDDDDQYTSDDDTVDNKQDIPNDLFLSKKERENSWNEFVRQ